MLLDGAVCLVAGGSSHSLQALDNPVEKRRMASAIVTAEDNGVLIRPARN